MSIEVYVQFFDSGEPSHVATADVLAAIGRPVVLDQSGWGTLSVGGVEWCGLTGVHGENTSNVCFHRPLIEPRLWVCIWQVLRLAHAVFYAPNDRRPLVASADTVAHLPVSLVESLGAPIVVRSGAEIAATMR